MKKRLALLLVTIFALTCAFTALSASAASFTDLIDLLPADASAISINGGTVDYSVNSDGSLKLAVAANSDIAWPSVVYPVNRTVDISVTPYLHLVFALEPNGEQDTFDVDSGRGVNGMIYYTVEGSSEEIEIQISKVAGRDVNDFRISGDEYIDFAKGAGVTGKITVTKVLLSIYGEKGTQSVTWNTLAFAGTEGTELPEEGSSSDEPEEPTSEETTDDESTADETTPEETADESSDDESSVEEPSDEETAPEETSSEAPAASTSSEPSAPTSNGESAPAESSEESSGSSTGLIALIAAICAVIIAAVVIVIIKKKK